MTEIRPTACEGYKSTICKSQMGTKKGVRYAPDPFSSPTLGVYGSSNAYSLAANRFESGSHVAR